MCKHARQRQQTFFSRLSTYATPFVSGPYSLPHSIDTHKHPYAIPSSSHHELGGAAAGFCGIPDLMSNITAGQVAQEGWVVR